MLKATQEGREGGPLIGGPIIRKRERDWERGTGSEGLGARERGTGGEDYGARDWVPYIPWVLYSPSRALGAVFPPPPTYTHKKKSPVRYTPPPASRALGAVTPTKSPGCCNPPQELWVL